MAYYFRLPLITDLTEDQQMALDDTSPIVISGGTIIERNIILLLRHIRNIDFGKSSVLLLSSSNAIIDYMGNKDITSSTIFRLRDFPFLNIKNAKPWKVNEIIIEEIQNLTYSTLQEVKKYADTLSYGADFNQQLYSKTVTKNEIQNLFPKNIHYNLQQNFRTSYHILNFVKSILIDFYISQASLDELEEENLGIKL